MRLRGLKLISSVAGRNQVRTCRRPSWDLQVWRRLASDSGGRNASHSACGEHDPIFGGKFVPAPWRRRARPGGGPWCRRGVVGALDAGCGGKAAVPGRAEFLADAFRKASSLHWRRRVADIQPAQARPVGAQDVHVHVADAQLLSKNLVDAVDARSFRLRAEPAGVASLDIRAGHRHEVPVQRLDHLVRSRADPPSAQMRPLKAAFSIWPS